MRYLVTDPDNDYIFVSDFQKLRQHLNRLINQACRTIPPSPPTPTPTLPYCKPDDIGTTQPSESEYAHRNTDHVYQKFMALCSNDDFRQHNFTFTSSFPVSRTRWCSFAVTVFHLAVSSWRLYIVTHLFVFGVVLLSVFAGHFVRRWLFRQHTRHKRPSRWQLDARNQLYGQSSFLDQYWSIWDACWCCQLRYVNHRCLVIKSTQFIALNTVSCNIFLGWVIG